MDKLQLMIVATTYINCYMWSIVLYRRIKGINVECAIAAMAAVTISSVWALIVLLKLKGFVMF